VNIEHRRRIDALFHELAYGRSLAQPDMNRLVEEWRPLVSASTKPDAEIYQVVRADGSPTGVSGPRWLFHLLGIRHLAVHIGLSTRSGKVLLQRRSPDRPQWPDALDMATAGHVPLKADGTAQSLEEAAWKELAEEIGLGRAEAARFMAEEGLQLVGEPYNSLDIDTSGELPFYNAEVRYLFAATLHDDAVALLQFADGEVAAVITATLQECWTLLCTERIASGMRYSLPRYLDWLSKREERNGETASTS
jgi:isopentenyldiphosphate isomerase